MPGSKVKATALSTRHCFVLEQLSCALADHVIATNESYKAVEMARDGVPEEKITIVRNGPELGRVLPPSPTLGCGQRRPTSCFLRERLAFKMGWTICYGPFIILLNDMGRRDFLCVVIGRGDAREAMMRACSEMGLDEFVWFTGWVPASDSRWARFLPRLTSASILIHLTPSMIDRR